MDSLTNAIETVEAWLDYEHESGRLDDETISAIDEVLAAAIYMDRGEIVNKDREDSE